MAFDLTQRAFENLRNVSPEPEPNWRAMYEEQKELTETYNKWYTTTLQELISLKNRFDEVQTLYRKMERYID